MGGPFDRLKFRDARVCANDRPPAAFLSLPLLLSPLSSSSFIFSTEAPLVSARGKKKMWVGHVSLHFALLHRTRRMTRDPKRSATLYSVAELAGDFIEVDLDRSVRPEERLRAREKNRCPKPAPLFFASFSWSRVTRYARIQLGHAMQTTNITSVNFSIATRVREMVRKMDVDNRR